MNILEIKQLYKKFGNQTVLDGLNMEVPEHSVFGFVGQNGAGKTTTMKIVLGLLPADGGSVSVCGETVSYGAAQTNRFIGYLPDVPEFYGYMTPPEYLKLCGEITGMSGTLIKKKSAELLNLVGLSENKKKIGGFSRGMKQRLGIAQALLNEPGLLLCDEPTSALDPIGRKEILDILSAVKGKTTVVFSTHILSDVERICDRIAVLNKGKLALSGSLAQIKEQHRQNGFVIEFRSPEEASGFLSSIHMPAHVLISNEVKTSLKGAVLTVTVSDEATDGRFLIRLLNEKGIVPVRFEMMEPTLESLFTEAVK